MSKPIESFGSSHHPAGPPFIKVIGRLCEAEVDKGEEHRKCIRCMDYGIRRERLRFCRVTKEPVEHHEKAKEGHVRHRDG